MADNYIADCGHYVTPYNSRDRMVGIYREGHRHIRILLLCPECLPLVDSFAVVFQTELQAEEWKDGGY